MNSIETQVLRRIGEDIASPDVFSDTEEGIKPIRDSINDGIQELCMTSGCYRRTYHLSLLENRQFYRLAPVNDYVVSIVSVFDREGRRELFQTDLTSLSKEDPLWMDQNGYPLKWMVLGLDVFAIYRIPSSKGRVLELKCICIPKPYARDGDQIRVGDLYQRATVQLAISEYYASRGDAARANEYLKGYLDLAGIMNLHPEQAERTFAPYQVYPGGIYGSKRYPQ